MSGYSTCIPRACVVLHAAGGTMSIGDLASALAVPVAELRVQIRQYTDYEVSPTINPAAGGRGLLALHPRDQDDDAAWDREADDDQVVLTGSASDFLGLEHFDARVYGPLLWYAERMLEGEPDNEVLAAATAKLHAHFVPGIRRRRREPDPLVAAVVEAIDQRFRIHLVYSRAWEPGVGEYVIEPYRLWPTKRGFEVDAAVVGTDGLRTFLLGRVRAWEVLSERFERPGNVTELCRAHRATQEVTGLVPKAGRWAVHQYADAVTWDRGASETSGPSDYSPGAEITFTAQVLPPVAQRCALMILAAGADAFLDDVELDQAAGRMAGQLWRHHRLDEG